MAELSMAAPGAASALRAALLADSRWEADEQAAAEAAERECQAEADAAAEAELAAAIADEILGGEPPADLAVETDGLPPQRARLARFDAWVQERRRALEQLEQGRRNFLRAMGAPVVTEKELAALREEQVNGFLGWMLNSISEQRPLPTSRKFERERLEARLVEESADREIAIAALDTVEKLIVQREEEIRILEARRLAFVWEAVRERGDEALAGRYVAAIAELQAVTKELAGLGVVLGPKFRTTYRDDIAIDLPGFGLPSAAWYRGGGVVRMDGPARPQIAVPPHEADAAARPWQALMKLWLSDPRAEPEAAAGPVEPPAPNDDNEEDDGNE